MVGKGCLIAVLFAVLALFASYQPVYGVERTVQILVSGCDT